MKIFLGKGAQVLLDTIISLVVLVLLVSGMVAFVSWVVVDMNNRFKAYRNVFGGISGAKLPSIVVPYKGSSFYSFYKSQRTKQ